MEHMDLKKSAKLIAKKLVTKNHAKASGKKEKAVVLKNLLVKKLVLMKELALQNANQMQHHAKANVLQ